MAQRVDPTKWDRADDDLLQFLHVDGVPVDDLAWAFGRTVETIERELARLRPAEAPAAEVPPAAVEPDPPLPVAPVDPQCRRMIETYLEAAGRAKADVIAGDLHLPLAVVAGVLKDPRFKWERDVYWLARVG